MDRRTVIKGFTSGVFCLGLAGCVERENLQSARTNKKAESLEDTSQDADANSSTSSTESSTTSSGNPDGPVVQANVQAVNFHSDPGACGRIEKARAWLEDTGAIVQGVVAVPNPCYSGSLSQCRFADSGDELKIVVEAQSSGSTDCRQCTAGIAYKIVVEFNDTTPNELSVYHKHSSRQELITTAV
jgi:hypothetical protein